MSMVKVDRPFVSPDVLEAVKKLRADGLEPTAQDICWLYEITRKQVDQQSLISRPVIIPAGYIDGTDIILRQITTGVRTWWSDIGIDMARRVFKGNSERVMMTLGWILAKPRGVELTELTDYMMYREVVKWIWAVSATAETVSIGLLRALNEEVTGGSEEVEVRGYNPTQRASTGFEAILVLAGVYGIDPKRLMWEYSEVELGKLADNISTVNAVKTGMGGGKTTETVDVMSVMTFRGVVENIRERLLKEKTV